MLGNCFFICGSHAGLVRQQNGDQKELFTASQTGNFESVCFQLERGVEVDCVNSYGSTALLLASLSGHTSIVDILIKRGATVNRKGPQGWTPLHGACYFGHKTVVRLLLDNNADIKLTTDDNRKAGSSFDASVSREDREEIQFFLKEKQAPTFVTQTEAAPPKPCRIDPAQLISKSELDLLALVLQEKENPKAGSLEKENLNAGPSATECVSQTQEEPVKTCNDAASSGPSTLQRAKSWFLPKSKSVDAGDLVGALKSLGSWQNLHRASTSSPGSVHSDARSEESRGSEIDFEVFKCGEEELKEESHLSKWIFILII